MPHFKKLWQLLTTKQKKQGMFLLLLILIGTVMELAGLGLIVPLVGLMSAPDMPQAKYIPLFAQNYFSTFTHQQMVFLVLGLLISVYTIKTCFLSYLAWVQAGFNLKIQADISRRLFRSYLNRSWLSFQKEHTASYIQNVNNEVQILIQRGYGSAIEIITNIALLFAAALVLLVVEPVATLIIAVAIGFSFWIFQILSKVRVSHWGRIRKEHEALRLHSLQQALHSAKEIKLRDKADIFIEKFHAHSLNLIYAGRWQSTLRKVPKYFFELLAVIGLTLAIVVMVFEGRELTHIAPVIALFAAVFIKLMPSVNAILTGLHSMRYIDPTINLIHEALSMPPKAVQEQDRTTLPVGSVIKFNRVNFSYPDAAKPVLRNIDFSFPAGYSVGLIGPSGAGKSTLIDIFLGLLMPDQGSILVDEQDISGSLKDWQSRIGYVPQSIYLLDDTLRRNIAFGEKDENIDESRVLEAVKNAQLQSFIESLPHRLDTVIGEDGSKTSGGEKQRIALARALYRNPSILVLDEATSSLDIDTEANVMETVHALKRQCTTFIVTHRLSTVEECDMVVRIEDGQIVSIDRKTP